MGAGAVLAAISYVLIFSFGLAERGAMKGDAFIVATISVLIFLVVVFVFYPIGSMFVGGFKILMAPSIPMVFATSLTAQSGA